MHYSAIIYATTQGYFVFNKEPFRLREKHLFSSPKEMQEACKLLSQGKIPERQKQLAQQHRAAVLSLSQEKTDIPPVFDHELYASLSDALQQDILPSLYEKNILLTKQDIRASVNREIFIVQATDAIQELDKAINLLSKRLREWYAYHMPEFVASIQTHEKFVELILTKDRKTLLKEIHVNEENSMGAPIDKKDLMPMLEMAKTNQHLVEGRKKNESSAEASGDQG